MRHPICNVHDTRQYWWTFVYRIYGIALPAKSKFNQVGGQDFCCYFHTVSCDDRHKSLRLLLALSMDQKRHHIDEGECCSRCRIHNLSCANLYFRHVHYDRNRRRPKSHHQGFYGVYRTHGSLSCRYYIIVAPSDPKVLPHWFKSGHKRKENNI